MDETVRQYRIRFISLVTGRQTFSAFSFGRLRFSFFGTISKATIVTILRAVCAPYMYAVLSVF